eukprot:scaffold18862_cov55-Attheya_sp.AAC.4
MPQFVENYNAAIIQSMGDVHQDIGQWFGDYLKDNGYVGSLSPQALKMLILKPFPVIYQDSLRPEHFEQALINTESVFNHYLKHDIEEEPVYGLQKLFRSPGRRFHE